MASTLSSISAKTARHAHLRLVDGTSTGIHEEFVARLFPPPRTMPQDALWGGSLLMLALLENEGYSLWHISTVCTAALQRLANDQVRFLFCPLSAEPERAATSASESLFSAMDVLLQSQVEAASIAALCFRDRNATLSDLVEYARSVFRRIGVSDC